LVLLNNNVNNSNINNNSNQHINYENNNNKLVNESLERNLKRSNRKNVLDNREITANKILKNNINLSSLSDNYLEKGDSKFINGVSESNIMSVDDRVKKIFSYNIWFCKKNEYYKKMQKIIRNDLSIENILSLVNSHEIIQKMLIERKLINKNYKANFFTKIKTNYSSIVRITGE